MTGQSGISGEFVRQKTLKNSIHCSGVGLHSGAKINMTLLPAPANTGVVFRRVDINGGNNEVKASWENAVETPLCTTLVGQDGIKIATIEHLMSALAGYEIDNVVVELNGAEVPVMDGSAAPFVFLIECAGTVEQDTPRRALRIIEHVETSESHRSASVAPGKGFSINFEIDFDSRAVGRQEWFVEVSQTSFKREVSRARTFGFLQEFDKLLELGLARGGSLDNAVVISGDTVMNEGGLRYDDEFVRHKVLDSIGDLYLIGGPIIGHFHGVRAGHALTLRLIKSLFAQESAWEWVDMTHSDLMPPLAAPARLQPAVAAQA
ncbi:UDP-3-O-acyl-N-acetylglucosamine deacetylase [Pelagibius sp. Alg239-R121]|uniref:UDP-3-O-acyl-N-acetylglucosamine deacetylase n=1 Tax=Pelagibius sp. Alg239-R121 TaxID=2993448 RepID=UPI0024A6CC42|nr:UDP-3-O-acyl-N-acetylglucosamine deacetylase [Pelagibius sp. Alg239-R121]